ncbi:hypothetical protein RB195_016854 [Necator americanus]|uniref:Phospholipid scramblase n=1 Tax=Necator americanus TaxID=51031 RepID=A0ABR1C2H3_NECAM
MEPGGISMRSFGEPLSANRLRHSDRNAELLLRRPLMAPSTSSEGMNGDVMQGTPTSTPNPGRYVYSHRFEETPSEAYPPPPVEYREVLNEHTGVVESASIIQPCSSREQDDTDIEEEIVNTFSKKSFIVPSKSQVLFYLSTSRHLRIHHTGCELQVTDSADFPLFDIWAEAACCGRPVWVIESYGRRVLVLSELQSRGISSLFPRPFLFRSSTSLNTQSVVDWNGDIIGYFLPGDPLLIQDSNRGILGRCVRMEGEGGSCWQCLVEGVDREVARLERGHLRFAADVSFQLKLLILAAMTRVVGQPRVQANCFPFLRY